MARVLALDIGERRIGVAISDEGGILAQPLMVIERRGARQDAARVAQIVKEYAAAEIVVGVPVTLAGEHASAAEKVHAFVAVLRAATDAPVFLVDERLSTVEADRRMREASVRREPRRQRVDAVAAALILERYLSRRGTKTDGANE